MKNLFLMNKKMRLECDGRKNTLNQGAGGCAGGDRAAGLDIWRRGMMVVVGMLMVMMWVGQVWAEKAGGDVAGGGEVGAGKTVNSWGQIKGKMTAIPSGGRLAIISVHGLIYDFTLESFKERAERAMQDGATVIVVEIDSPGGVLTSAIRLSRYIKELSSKVPTVAWVRDEAYSAGTLVAGACGWVVMSPRSVMGDCAPIVLGQNLAETERAKALSPLLEEFGDSARLNGYDFALFEAMCRLGVKVYRVEPKAAAAGEQATEAVSGQAEGSGGGGISGEMGSGEISGGVGSGGGRAVNYADYVFMTGVAGEQGELDKSGGRQISREEDAGRWQLVAGVTPFHDGKTLLTLSQDRAMEVGLCKGIVKNEEELKVLFGAAVVGRYSPTVVQGAAYWLTQPWVKAILVLVVLVGFFLEFQAPGMSVPGIVGMVALVCLVGAPLLVGLGAWWHVLLIFGGGVLVVVELFLFPGVVVCGVLGLVMIFVGLVLGAVPGAGGGGGLPPREMMGQMQWSAIGLLVGFLLGVGVLGLLVRHFGKLPVLGAMILKTEQAGGGDAVLVAGEVSGGEVLGAGALAVGAVGVAISTLRPSGRAEIGGKVVDVMSRNEWISAGTKVKVVEMRGNVIVVEAETAGGV